jgi:anaerobic selenocysteine-containing dehydrogenase
MLRYPDRALVDAALRAAPFVVVTDLFLTETAELADLVIPVCSAFEKSGTTTDLAGDVLPVIGSVIAPGGVGADGDVIVALAEHLGVELPLPDAIDAKIRELVRTAPPPPGAPAHVRSTAKAAEGALRVIPETTIFTGGGTLAFDARVAELRTPARATLHPDTARALGLVDGDRVSVTATPLLRDLVVVVDPRVPAGAVALVDGVAGAPLGALAGAVSVSLEKALVTA